jgi:hypothetical protein
MTNHGRKYGEQDSHPIPLWNGVFEHCHRIGDALWEFAWCIDKITKERDGVGLVLGGFPVKLSAIVGALKGSNRETVRRHMNKLEEEKYIRRRRTPYGHVIEVLNSRKFSAWKHPKEKPQNEVSQGIEKHGFVQEKPKSVQEKHGFVVYKEDSTETIQRRSSGAAAASELWRLTGIDPNTLPGPFLKLCQDLYGRKNGQPLGEFMGVCMDAWQALGGKTYPPQFAKAKARISAKEKEQAGRLPELEAEPWQK